MTGIAFVILQIMYGKEAAMWFFEEAAKEIE